MFSFTKQTSFLVKRVYSKGVDVDCHYEWRNKSPIALTFVFYGVPDWLPGVHKARTPDQRTNDPLAFPPILGILRDCPECDVPAFIFPLDFGLTSRFPLGHLSRNKIWI